MDQRRVGKEVLTLASQSGERPVCEANAAWLSGCRAVLNLLEGLQSRVSTHHVTTTGKGRPGAGRVHTANGPSLHTHPPPLPVQHVTVVGLCERHPVCLFLDR